MAQEKVFHFLFHTWVSAGCRMHLLAALQWDLDIWHQDTGPQMKSEAATGFIPVTCDLVFFLPPEEVGKLAKARAGIKPSHGVVNSILRLTWGLSLFFGVRNNF